MRKAVRPGSFRPPRPKTRRAPALEWLWDAAGTQPRATLSGNRRALIENHAGILEFTPERVRLAAGRGEIRVTGSALTLAEVRPRSLIVRGHIESVTLPPEGGDAP